MSFADANGRLLPFLLVSTFGISAAASACMPPREGIWTFESFDTPIAFTEPQGNGYMRLTRDPNLPNVYTGDAFYRPPEDILSATSIGRCFVFTDKSRVRIPLLYFLHAVFDEKECLLNAAGLVPAFQAHDTISWTVVGGEEMYGKIVITFGPLVFYYPYTCMQKIKFCGEVLNVDFPSLFTNAEHSELNTTSHRSL